VSSEMGGADRGECDRPVDLGCQVYLAGNKAGAVVCSSSGPGAGGALVCVCMRVYV
jgi:hypothetical protein